ncbi:MAG: hypothetical protein ACLQDF_00230 [Desulfomonilia bacterium]
MKNSRVKRPLSVLGSYATYKVFPLPVMVKAGGIDTVCVEGFIKWNKVLRNYKKRNQESMELLRYPLPMAGAIEAIKRFYRRMAYRTDQKAATEGTYEEWMVSL